jgi:hypothetical protein
VSMKTMALKIRQANNIVLNTTGGKGKS